MTTKTLDTSEKYMRLALALARRGEGFVEPNPMVGAVLVRGNKIVGRGWHRRFGGHHAEIEALRQAGSKARGSTLYVTLEPCCHHGKTGPCTDALIAAGVLKVFAAIKDPNPLVSGQGFARLRAAGIAVVVGLCQKEAELLSRPFVKRITTSLPYVIGKWAQTIDGCIADRHNQSQWISSEPSRQQVHLLRARVDVMMVGIGTALADNPMLTARLPRGKKPARIAVRLIVDSDCHLPPQSKLAQTVAAAPVIVAHGTNLDTAGLKRRQLLVDCGIQMLEIARDSRGRLRLRSLLGMLAKNGMTNILVEGGPRLMASLLSGHLVDEAHVYIAPAVLGDIQARHAVEDRTIRPLARAITGELIRVERVGPDVHLVFAPR